MVYEEPPYTPSRRYFNLPEILASDSWRYDGQRVRAPIVVIALFKTTEEQRAAIIARLASPTPPYVNAETVLRGLAIVPWLRNYEPVIEEVIYDIVRDGEPSRGFVSSTPFVFLSSKGHEEGSCVISHYVRIVEGEDAKNHHDGGYSQEFARVPLVKARGILDTATKENSWFPDVLDEECRVLPLEKETMREGSVTLEGDGIQSVEWKWPGHLPESLKMKKDEPIVVSLIHLSVTEIEAMQAEMGKDGEQDVKIINWPSDAECGSTTDLWNIFDHIKPDWSEVAPYGEVFGFFIDSLHLSGPHYAPEVIQVCRSHIADNYRGQDSAAFETENKVTPVAITTASLREKWTAAWNPTGGEWSNGVKDNYAIRGIGGFPDRLQTQFVIANPEAPLVACELPIFVLVAITSTQEHALRALFGSDVSAWQMINIPSASNVRNLVKWFQSAEYLRYNKAPPSDFVAVDALALSALDGRKLLLGTGATVWHEQDDGYQLARDEVGYIVGRCSMYEYDSYDQWTNSCSMAMGLMSYIEHSGEEDSDDDDYSEGERYYWDCFDQEDEELKELITTRE
jgi:hypothetical protein